MFSTRIIFQNFPDDMRPTYARSVAQAPHVRNTRHQMWVAFTYNSFGSSSNQFWWYEIISITISFAIACRIDLYVAHHIAFPVARFSAVVVM